MSTFRNMMLAASVGALISGQDLASADTLGPPYIPYPNPPASLAEAKAQAPTRRSNVVDFMACGNEAAFIDFLLNEPPAAGEDIGPMLMGKMVWLRGFATQDAAALKVAPCSATTILPQAGVSTVFKTKTGQFDPAAANAGLSKLTGDACQNVVTSIATVNDQAVLTFAISSQCMRAEVNAMASRLLANEKSDKTAKTMVQAEVGTDGTLCLSTSYTCSR